MKKIVIVGGGPAAVSMCMQFLDELKRHNNTHERIELVVLEKSGRIGHGLPYPKYDDSLILNLPKGIMEPKYEQKGNFSEWLKSVPECPQDTDFPPRYYFGEYLNYLSLQIQKAARENNVDIEYQTYCEVTDVVEQEKGIKVLTSRNTIDCDYVIFCTGHMPPSTFTQFIGKCGYHADPWKDQVYQSIDPDSHVVILGTRLTAIDVALKLFSRGHRNKVSMVSRSGLLPTVLSKEIPRYALKYLTLETFNLITRRGLEHLPLEKWKELFRKEINEAEKKEISFNSLVKSYRDMAPHEWLKRSIVLAEKGGKPYQQVLYAAYSLFFYMWNFFSIKDRQEFIRDYQSLFLYYLPMLPLDNAYKIQEYISSEQLDVRGGVKHIEKISQEKFSVYFEDFSHIVTKSLINATGFGDDPMLLPLYHRLITRGVLAKHPAGGIQVDHQTLNVVSSKQEKNPRMFALGEVTTGEFLVTRNMSNVALQARQVSLSLVRDCNIGKEPLNRVRNFSTSSVKGLPCLSMFNTCRKPIVKTAAISAIITLKAAARLGY